MTVRFIRNAANTPVYLLASGNITILQTIDVSGENGTSLRGGFSGPGGFDGGSPGITGLAPGDGHGPGAGRGGNAAGTLPGGRAAYGTAPALAAPPNPAADALNGQTYGTQLLVPLVGGSGGGGSAQAGAGGGGGGGGAILIASSTEIVLNGIVYASGGNQSFPGGIGSGGAVRLLAPVIRGVGRIDVSGSTPTDGAGRIRCDLIERANFGLSFYPANAPVTTDQFFTAVIPPNLPTLRLIRVANVDVPPGAPAGFTVNLPFNAPESQNVVIEASGFGTQVPIAIKRTPASGPALPITEVIINNPGPNPATVTIPLQFPPNVPITVHAWTR